MAQSSERPRDDKDRPSSRLLGFNGAPAIVQPLVLRETDRRAGVQLVQLGEGSGGEAEYIAREAAEKEAVETARLRGALAAAVAAGSERELVETMGHRAPALRRLAEIPDLEPAVRARVIELGRELLNDPTLAESLRDDLGRTLAKQQGEIFGANTRPQRGETALDIVAIADKLGIQARSEREQLTLGYALLQVSYGVGDTLPGTLELFRRYGVDSTTGDAGLQQYLLRRMRALAIARDTQPGSEGARFNAAINDFGNSRYGGWKSTFEPVRTERFVAGQLEGSAIIDDARIKALVTEAGEALEDGLWNMTDAQRTRVFAQAWSLGFTVGALGVEPQPTAYAGRSWLRSDSGGEKSAARDAHFDAANPTEGIAALRADYEARVSRRIAAIVRATSESGQPLRYLEIQVLWPQFEQGNKRMFRGGMMFPLPSAGDVVGRVATRRNGRTVDVD